ncbi:SMI1/KNR4 family protein [Spirilliplanes yamanashiensis]|uniref:Knr4/Smi1-like domain-containing protein n=1 Tax=Spirilliplanes yamanashiensis TaxID=42233 RepID=A0A8J3Y535_9ACTN|nr:SMI1/KNR4 family protein [Spirilliplanes yamanashiensis]MDP9819221.1 hypothetical protein [Spirilliplanes yamanashiensis]GIJ01956.1 hypothetical protein Sya03_13080 [Spirilliplanes yamanashiensis]
MTWPGGGPWVVVTTSTQTDWATGLAALAAASAVPVAVLRLVRGGPGHGVLGPRRGVFTPGQGVFGPGRGVLGPPTAAGDVLGRLRGLATRVDVRTGGHHPPHVDGVVTIVRALERAHGLVLVGAPDGLLVPLGADGWTLVDVAKALRAPVVVVSGSSPGAAGHAALVLDALTRREVPATVLAVGDDPLPVDVAGRIPRRAVSEPDLIRAGAAGWLDPALHADGSRPPQPRPAPPPADAPAPARPLLTGRRFAIALVSLFVVLAAVLWTVPFVRAHTVAREQQRFITGWDTELDHRDAWAQPPGAYDNPEPPAPSLAPVTPEQVCPRNEPGVTPAEPDARTTARVNAAWARIERWLARHAPRTREELRRPASASAIADAQRRMSVDFPPDLVASLRRHDGSAPNRQGLTVPPLYTLLSLDEIVGEWEDVCGSEAEFYPDMMLDRRFVPIASDPGFGFAFADQSTQGYIGDYVWENGGPSFDGWPTSVAGLLEEMAHSLETGDEVRGAVPEVVDGRLGWSLD